MSKSKATWWQIAGIGLLATSAACAAPAHYEDRSKYAAPRTIESMAIDGVANETIWQQAKWQQIKHRWLGPEYSSDDFSGRYKVVWDEHRIYILSEIVDDILIDTHRNPLVQYWDDDALEIFIDEDYSGGDHQFNHNAFAYHMSLDNQAIDIGTNEVAQNYSHHVESKWLQHDGRLIWEVAIEIYSDDYVDDSTSNQPLKLAAGKRLGLMVAYCDNDGSELRENFVGSETVPTGPKNRGWIDAGLFGSLLLVNQI